MRVRIRRYQCLQPTYWIYIKIYYSTESNVLQQIAHCQRDGNSGAIDGPEIEAARLSICWWKGVAEHRTAQTRP